MPRLEVLRLRDDVAIPPLWDRVRDAVRGIWTGPMTSRSPELARLLGGGTEVSAGVTVTHDTALMVGAFVGGIALLSGDLAAFPLGVWRRLAGGGKTRATSHPLYRLLHLQPSPESTSFLWRQVMFAEAAAFGNSYSEIERDRFGRPIALWHLDSSRVHWFRGFDGQMQYHVSNPDGSEVVIPAGDMLHFRGPSIDGVTGMDTVRQAREALGLALAAERFGGTFFGNGATFGGVIKFKGPKPTEMSETGYREALEARHQGVKRAHKLLALYNDADFKETGTAPEQAQFLETRTFQIREVARFLRMPPHKLGDLADATFSNVAQQNLDYYSSCLRTWLVMAEQEMATKLLMPSELDTIVIEHVVEGFLRVDPESRADFYEKMIRARVMTPDECRELENLPPLGQPAA